MYHPSSKSKNSGEINENENRIIKKKMGFILQAGHCCWAGLWLICHPNGTGAAPCAGRGSRARSGLCVGGGIPLSPPCCSLPPLLTAELLRALAPLCLPTAGLCPAHPRIREPHTKCNRWVQVHNSGENPEIPPLRTTPALTRSKPWDPLLALHREGVS